MDAKERTRLIDAVVGWADAHSQSESPVLRMGGGRSFSPAEIASALKEGTPDGDLLLRVLENAYDSIDEVIGMFARVQSRQRQQHGAQGSA